MTKKRLTKIALLLVASAALLFLVWLDGGMFALSDRTYINHTARRYMLSDLVPEGRGKNADYVFDAGDHVLFISTNGYSANAREKQNGCSLQPSTSQSWYKDMDMSVPFCFTAYCSDDSAASAQLELYIRGLSDDESSAVWEHSYSSEASVKNGVASLAIKTESDEVADEKNLNRWNGLLGFTSRESHLEYCAFSHLQAWANTGELLGHSATAIIRFYDTDGALISESVFEMGEKES